MKILYDLAQMFQKDFSWKYFAISRGKGVFDGSWSLNEVISSSEINEQRCELCRPRFRRPSK